MVCLDECQVDWDLLIAPPPRQNSICQSRQIRGAAEDCRREGIAFLPLVVESFGGWHSAAEAEVKKLGAALARQTGQDESEVLRHLWGRLGLLLQRGNAAILGNRLPSHPPPEVDGFH